MKARWFWGLLGALALCALLAGAALVLLLNNVVTPPIHLTIDGEEILLPSLHFAGWSMEEKLLFAGAAVIALMAALLVIPVALLFAGVGLLLAVAVPLVLALSPLLLIGLLIWWLCRPKARP